VTVEIGSEPRESREFDGRHYVMERAITGDVGFVKAWKADTRGNLVFRGTSMNFNPECAKAAKFTIAEVEEIVEAGELDPNHIHVPGVYVDKVVLGKDYEKRIERVTVSTPGEALAAKVRSRARAPPCRRCCVRRPNPPRPAPPGPARSRPAPPRRSPSPRPPSRALTPPASASSSARRSSSRTACT